MEGDQQAGQRRPGQGGALNTHPSARQAGLEMSARAPAVPGRLPAARPPRAPGAVQTAPPAPTWPLPALHSSPPLRPASPADSSPQPGRPEGAGVGATGERG